ncbi:thiolase family protein [Paraburkholderia flagellata]|uniref:thiolase family protein n=1 Tax=Paraburkholderia flagellata TaxID=2883241 RepID=UPI001F372D74|nr:thiolase family protein [Paraburkholderia flagellata]
MSMTNGLRSVNVVGTGMIRFGRFPEVSLSQLAAPAVIEALDEAGIDRRRIGALYCGTVSGGPLAAQRIARETGLTGIEAANFENACSSSASAFRHAYLAIAAGAVDCAVVVGVEQLTRLGGGPLDLGDEDVEAANGLTMPALYAMRAQRYMHEFDLSPRDLALIAVKARANGALNPYAQIRSTTSVDEVLGCRTVASPLTLHQCCPLGDGASAVVLAASNLPEAKPGAVKILASHLTSGRYMQGARDMTTPEVTVRCANETYESCGLGPSDIDLVECHDAFTIAELLYYEALGFAAHGDGARLIRDGETSLTGRIPFNPSGGLLCRGHPLGASGIAQIVEITRQLQGRCGARQVARDKPGGPRIGLAHITGGGTYGFDHGACAIHILGR